MTCSARLPVYTLFISAFVPNQRVFGPLYLQGLVMLGLYALGTLSAFLIAALLKATKLKEVSLPFYMEMPPYRYPTAKALLTTTWDSAKYFVRKAGTIILGTSVVLFVLLNVPEVTPPPGLDPAEAKSYQMERSVAGSMGRAIEPVFEPLGFGWQINVALIGSLSAREVFVSTLGQIEAATSDQDLDAALHDTINPATGEQEFTPPTVAALLVFFVYALQCMSTVAVMRRETNSWRWPAFAWAYMFVLAWTMGFLAHQLTEMATT
jgi:ferrous iron transport protein B